MITNQTLNAIKENIINGAKENFINDGYLAPVAIILPKIGELKMILLNLSTIEEKEKTELFLKEYVINNNALMIMTISECWMKKMDKKEFELIGGSLKNVEDKTEGVIITFETAFTCELIQFEIDKEKQILHNEMRSTEYEGRFSNILKKPINEN